MALDGGCRSRSLDARAPQAAFGGPGGAFGSHRTLALPRRRRADSNRRARFSAMSRMLRFPRLIDNKTARHPLGAPSAPASAPTPWSAMLGRVPHALDPAPALVPSWHRCGQPRPHPSCPAPCAAPFAPAPSLAPGTHSAAMAIRATARRCTVLAAPVGRRRSIIRAQPRHPVTGRSRSCASSPVRTPGTSRQAYRPPPSAPQPPRAPVENRYPPSRRRTSARPAP